MPAAMRPPSSPPTLAALALALGLAAGCGEEIGDECSLSSDCSSEGDRFCDTGSSGGYCTIIGCDVDSCPEEAVCVRFFTDATSNRPCDALEEDRTLDDCTADEICTLGGSCAPRSSEIRYCMRSCDGDDDCRENYECRDAALMREHGGEPVRAPGEPPDGDPPRFCAAAPFSS